MTEKICRINVDSYLCNSCGACVELCPEVFRINEATDAAEAVVEAAPFSDALQQAASFCPSHCIELDC